MVPSSPASGALLQKYGWHNCRPIVASGRRSPDLYFRFRHWFWLRGKCQWRWQRWQLRWWWLWWQRVDTGCVIRREMLILGGYICSSLYEGNRRPFLRFFTSPCAQYLLSVSRPVRTPGFYLTVERAPREPTCVARSLVARVLLFRLWPRPLQQTLMRRNIGR